jgi:hypothetical protein
MHKISHIAYLKWYYLRSFLKYEETSVMLVTEVKWSNALYSSSASLKRHMSDQDKNY